MYARTSQKKDLLRMAALPVLPMFPKPATLLELHTAIAGKKYYTAAQMRQYASKVIAQTKQSAAAATAASLAVAPKITAFVTRHDAGDMLWFDRNEALDYCGVDLPPEPLVLLSDVNMLQQGSSDAANTPRLLSAARSVRSRRKLTRIDVDDLAQEIRRLNGNNSLGAGLLAEALLPFLKSHALPIN